MNPRKISSYKIVASAFNVLDISTEIKYNFPPDESLEKFYEEWMEKFFIDDTDPNEYWLCLIRDEDIIYGFLDYFDPEKINPGNNHKTAKELADPIPPNLIIPSTLPIIDLPELLIKHPFYFILTRNDITHVVTTHDLDKLPMKLCIFTLFMNLESEMIKILINSSISINQYITFLTEQRRSKIYDLYKLKFGKEIKSHESWHILYCTNFIDKVKMIKKNEVILRKLPFESNNSFDSFFNWVQDIINKIAHSESIIQFLSNIEKFNSSISKLKEIIEFFTKFNSGD